MPSTRPAQPADLEILAKTLGLKPDKAAAALPSAVVRICAPGETIVREGDAGTDVYVVLKGKPTVSCSQWIVFSKQVARLKPGDLFGEIGFLVPAARTASVVADGPCEVFRLPGAELKALLDKKPALRERIEEEARQRVYKLSAKMGPPP